MSKITFRADDDLIERLEAFDASKSEVMREALREYLGETSATEPGSASSTPSGADAGTIDELIEERVDSIIADRLRERRPRRPQDVNVNISLAGEHTRSVDPETERQHGDSADTDDGPDEPHRDRETAEDSGRKTDVKRREDGGSEQRKTCAQCGETLGSDHVYCPNCGEKASRRVFCDCGDELRSDWGFCPGCGRRTPAADVLDKQ